MGQSLSFTTESTGNSNLILVEDPGSNLQTGDIFTAHISSANDDIFDEWESSNCTYIAAGEFSRDVVITSGANDAFVTFTSGVKDVLVQLSAEKFIRNSTNVSITNNAIDVTTVNATTINATTSNVTTINVTTVNSSGSPRIANATAIPSGGTTGTGYKFSSTANFGIFFGSGAPTLSAAKGSLYLRSDGSGIGDRAYINTNGSTSWTALTTAA